MKRLRWARDESSEGSFSLCPKITASQFSFHTFVSEDVAGVQTQQCWLSKGSGFSVQGSGHRDARFRAQDLEFRVLGSGFWVLDLECRV